MRLTASFDPHTSKCDSLVIFVESEWPGYLNPKYKYVNLLFPSYMGLILFAWQLFYQMKVEITEKNSNTFDNIFQDISSLI